MTRMEFRSGGYNANALPHCTIALAPSLPRDYCSELTGKSNGQKRGVGTHHGWVILGEANKKQPSQAFTPEMGGGGPCRAGQGQLCLPPSSAGSGGVSITWADSRNLEEPICVDHVLSQEAWLGFLKKN